MYSMSSEPLLKASCIASRVEELGKSISSSYKFDVIISILTGAFIFTADLCRAMPTKDLRIRFIKASSYGESTESSGSLKVTGLKDMDIKGAKILLVDDILDSGRTLKTLVDMFMERGAETVKTCVLLDKKERREVPIQADFCGFEIPNEFVVGYGLDFANDYRSFPDIWTLNEKL